jgi:aminopeptidase N
MRQIGHVFIAATVLLFLLCAEAPGQERIRDRANKGLRRVGLPAGIKYIGPQPFDILHYALDLSFAMTTREMGGTVGITMVLKAPTDSLVLNELGLRLDSLRVDGANKSYSVDPANETFTVRLGSRRNAGDTLRLAIVYQRDTAATHPSDRYGYYYFTPESVGGELPDTLGYTMSEPSDARLWMPCFDDPSEKAMAEINATVPAGFVAASNGKLLGVTQNGNGTVTYHWREDHQIAPYLICVTISKWTVYTYPFVRAVNDTVPVQYYVFKPDSAAYYLPRVAEMLRAYSDVYGDYPWDKYAMSGVTPFNFGGMEHQSMTTLHRAYQTNEIVVAHELAHQWWGDLVTCGTWKDIWLNESFATYSEAIWMEHLGGTPALRSYMRRNLNFSSASWKGAIYDQEGQGFNLFDNVVYDKGGWVLHTLRGVLGDSLFFATLHAYRQKFAQGNAVTDDLRAVADSVTSNSMNWFFDEWIYKPGWPVYAFGSSWAADTVTLRIEQHQQAPSPVYAMPIQVRFYHGGSDTTITVQNSQARQLYFIPLAFKPDSVKFDPDDWILKQISETPVSVEKSPLPLTCQLEQNYPNPFNPTTSIKYTIGGTGGLGLGTSSTGARGSGLGTSKTSLIVYDLLGRQVAVLVNEKKAPGSYEAPFDGSRLASGVYYCRLTVGTFVQTRTMMLIK